MSAAVGGPIRETAAADLGDALTVSPTVEADETDTLPSRSVHPVLARAFAALDEAGVDSCLLRGANLADPTGDVDLLVAPGNLDAIDREFDALGARHHRSWGRGSHRFFVIYDAPSDRWLKFDFVSELAFDARQAVVGPPADGVLARRQRADGVWKPSSADAFWLLLLHCMLDKSAFSPRYRDELGELAASALDGAPELRAWVDGLSPRRWGERQIVDAIRDGRWDQLLAVGRAIRRASARRGPASFITRTVGAIGLRRVSRLVGQLAVRPVVIALIGPDGSGKSSVARGLAQWWPGGGRVVHLGLYARGVGGGPFGRAWHLARARIATRYHLQRGRLVVLDRHPVEDRQERTGMRARARARVMRLLAPSPTQVVVLDATADELVRRRPDHDRAWLDRKRVDFQSLSAAHPEWAVVDASRDLDAVTANVATIVWDAVQTGGNGHTTELDRALRG
jgi:thymidylate kinase